MSARTFRLAAPGTVLALALCAATSRGDVVTLTLDDPDQTVDRPAAGSITLDFKGKISIAAGYSYVSSRIDSAYTEDEDHSITTSSAGFRYADANDGNSASGLMFTAEVTAATAPGPYYTNPTDPLSSLIVFVNNSDAVMGETYAAFSIQVNVEPTPEPSTLALTALGGPLAALTSRSRTAAG